MDADKKTTGLKEVQGLVSREGYASGQLRSHFYPDVPRALEAWTKAGVRCCVYSSGSVEAQKNFYRYADAGDLSQYITGNFDTTIGAKREAASYAAIAFALNAAPNRILFLSDVLAELDAAKAAGLQTALVVRPGNKPVLENHPHRAIRSFDELRMPRVPASK
jgi:enolase-phosphatase E1